MLYIDKATILKFDLEMLKKHRRAIQFIAVLLFIVGLLCISFPFVSGDILSTVLVSSAFNGRQLATARYWCAGYRHCLDIPWCNADGVCNAGFHTGGN